MKLKDLTNQVFGRLTVLKRDFEKEQQIIYWLCECKCGNIVSIRGDHLKSGRSKSCGCLNAELSSVRNKTHGKSNLKEYRVWATMIARCFNPNNTSYIRYGKIGITVCGRYVSSFENFFNDLGLRPTPEHSVDRIKNHLHYSCGKCEDCVANGWEMNVHWATRPEQSRNRRDNVWIEYGEEKLIASEWARKLNVRVGVFLAYIKSGHSDIGAILHYSKPNWNRKKKVSKQHVLK